MKISSLLTNASIATGLAAAAIISAPLASNAASLVTFGNIFTSGGAAADKQNGVTDIYAGQLSLVISDKAAGVTEWRFFNANNVTDTTSPYYPFRFTGTPISSFIAQIYLEGSVGAGLTLNSLNFGNTPNNNTSNPNNGVLFTTASVNPASLPQGNNIGFNDDFVIGGTDPGSNKAGIDVGQSLGILFNGPSESDIIKAINKNTLRVGIHLQGIGTNGYSDAYVSVPSKAVPVPGFLLGVVAAGALGGSRLMKKKQLA